MKYYLDATFGNDSNPGSLAEPWRTISKVNALSFEPGDVIAFKCGEVWRETLIPRSAGTIAGWTFADGHHIGSSTFYLSIFYKVAGAGESTTVTFNGTAGQKLNACIY